MTRKRFSPAFSGIAVIIAFAIAAISFFGIILKNDLVGRFLFGTTWSCIGLWWFGHYLRARRAIKSKAGPEEASELQVGGQTSERQERG
ncbi:MAG: hypothetical protein GTO42_08535 [Candidatus Latescibacteria bacterium]|nr:hypothetical protein [Candidatus Latescibacterota bacterium]NIO29005.1 hypothetical protein [Candidatus Latescibacterota bacterium]NIO56630.1 hypothetical protein [Candidatus Latescibacterota bacterium]NIT02214.1 hypothetical protein [Candidatus Latescibacterota bacterium]NIT39099.1 hypothetical protein [Candidatus Latescibacterota bacterium]